MRVLIMMSNWPGHFHPMVAQGWALRAAGHEVLVGCTPAHAGAVLATGLTPAPVLHAEEMEVITRVRGILQLRAGTWEHRHPPLHPLTGLPVSDGAEVEFGEVLAPLTRIARRSMRGVEELVRGFPPDLVLHDPLSFEGLLIGRQFGVPAFVQLWGPIGLAENEMDLSLTPNDYGNAFGRLGLGPVDFSHLAGVLDPCPPALASVSSAPAVPARYIPYNGPGGDLRIELPDTGRPRVCLVWGNSVSRVFGEANSPIPAVVRALADRDVDVLVTLNSLDHQMLANLPANVRLLDYTPLRLLLPHCDAVIHSSGGGCSMTSVVCGTPQLLLPNGLDQPLIASRLAATGAARAVPSWAVDEDVIRHEVDELLGDDGYRIAAAELAAAALALPSPAEVVATLEAAVHDRSLEVAS